MRGFHAKRRSLCIQFRAEMAARERQRLEEGIEDTEISAKD
jgi:hypothetical protein